MTNNTAIMMKASRILQSKAGPSPISKAHIESAQYVIDDIANHIDFMPLAHHYTDTIANALSTIENADTEDNLFTLRASIMQMKANATMFGYAHLGEIATLMLSFAEHIKTVDQAALDVLKTHMTILSLVVSSAKQSSTSHDDHKIIQELSELCQRYYAKHSSLDDTI